MIYMVCVCLPLLFVVGMIKGRKREGPLLYRGIEWFLDQSRKNGWKKPEWVSSRMILQAWIMMMAGSLFLAGAVWKQNRIKDQPVDSLERPLWNEDAVEEKMLLEWQNDDGVKEKKEIMVTVGQEKITEEQLDEVFERAKKQLDQMLFSGEVSADRVDRPLVLPEELPDDGISISWESSSPEYFDWMGQLGEEVPREGVQVCLTATLMLQEKEDTYQKNITVYPERYTEQEELEYCLDQASSAGENRMMLPKEIQGKKLVWKKVGEKSEAVFGIFVLISPVFLFLMEKQKFLKKFGEVIITVKRKSSM